MARKKKNTSTPSSSNPMAKDLGDRKYHQRVVPSKKSKKIIEEVMKEREDALRRLADK